MSLIAALFLAGVIWFIISILRIILNTKRQTRSFFNQFSGQAGAQQPRQEPSRKAGWTRPSTSKSKKIDSNTGEYVEFEEITTASSTYTSTGSDSRSSRTGQRTEAQITDVEWEDI